jgi:2-oxoglutarate ferredoxin oxidoreductase subunit beta
MRLARLQFPNFPVPVGVLYQEQADSFKLPKHDQHGSVSDLEKLYRKGAYWSRG